MKIFTVIHEDPHIDISTEVFESKRDAIEYARKTAKKCCRSEEDYSEEKIDEWIFFAKYAESCSIHVVEQELRKDKRKEARKRITTENRQRDRERPRR